MKNEPWRHNPEMRLQHLEEKIRKQKARLRELEDLQALPRPSGDGEALADEIAGGRVDYAEGMVVYGPVEYSFEDLKEKWAAGVRALARPEGLSEGDREFLKQLATVLATRRCRDAARLRAIAGEGSDA